MSYFRGWRRTLGIVTLALACLFTAGWVRSHSVFDTVAVHVAPSFSDHTQSGMLFSWKRGIVWSPLERARDNQGQVVPRWRAWDSSSPFAVGLTSELDQQFDSPAMQWKFQIFGIRYGEFVDPFDSPPGSGPWYMIIPYWSIVLPFTLLSAYLLLSKPRTSSKALPTTIAGSEASSPHKNWE